MQCIFRLTGHEVRVQSSMLRHIFGRECALLILAVIFVVGLTWVYTLLGIGMPMNALEMTALGGAPAPDPMAVMVWTPATALFVFMMWWMMIAMMVPSAAPTVLRYAGVERGRSHPVRCPAGNEKTAFAIDANLYDPTPRTFYNTLWRTTVRYLHSAIRISDIDESLNFFCNLLGLVEVGRRDSEKGRYTNLKLAAPEDAEQPKKTNSLHIELTYNWDPEEYTGGRNFGHLAFAVDDIYDLCQRLMDAGIVINRPPREGHMAFVKTPDGISLELLQKNGSLPVKEPWASMPNTGSW